MLMFKHKIHVHIELTVFSCFMQSLIAKCCQILSTSLKSFVD